MFQPYLGILGNEHLTEEHDPDGVRRQLRREVETFARMSEPETIIEEDRDSGEVSIRVEFVNIDETVEAFNRRYRQCFDVDDLGRMLDAADEYVRAAEEASEVLEPEGDGEVEQKKYRALHMIIASSVAIAESLKSLMETEVARRARVEEEDEEHDDGTEIEPGYGDNDETAEHDDDEEETWDIGTAGDPDGTIAIDAPVRDDDNDDEDPMREGIGGMVHDLLHARSLDRENPDIGGNAIDADIVETAFHACAELTLIREGLEELGRHVSGDWFRHRINALDIMRKAGVVRCSPATLSQMRFAGELARYLDSLEANDAAECFESLFEDVAQEALLSIERFTSIYGTAGDRDETSDHDAVINAYVDALRERCLRP